MSFTAGISRFLIWAGIFFSSLCLHAADFENGVLSAKAKNWPEAESIFRKHIEASPLDANAYYNLGTTLAVQKKYAEAIWALEKALKLAPGLEEAQNNIQYCYTKLGIQETWEPALPYFREKAYRFGIDSWTYIAIATGFVFAVLLFIALVTKKATTRKITLIFTFLTGVLMIFTIRNALVAYQFKYNETHAVLMQDEKSVFINESGNANLDLRLLKGNRFEISGKSKGRIGLILRNQMIIWINADHVKII